MCAALACLVAGVLAACGGGGGAVKPKGPVGPPIEAKQAEQGASDLVAEIYDTLGRGNKDSLFTLLEDSLIVFGPRRTDMLATRAEALVALGQVVDPKAKKKVNIKRGKLELVASPGGRSAWAFDLVAINGEPIAVMAVLSNAADVWLVSAVAVAHTPGAQQVKAELAKDAVVPPGAMGSKKIDPAARPAVEKFQKGLLDQSIWGDDLAGRSDSIAIGPTSGEVARGKKEIKAAWQKRLDAKTRAAVSGEITAAVTDDGQLAWVSAPITRVEGDGEPMPLRAFAVFEKDGAGWKLIALHESVALAEPGAGASFKKVVPPKLAEPKPVEVVAAEPKPDPAKKQPEKKKIDKKADRDDKPADPELKKEKKKKAKAATEPEPVKKKKKKKPALDDDETPKKKKLKQPAPAEDDDETPKKKTKKKKVKQPAPAEDDDETPKKKTKKKKKKAPAEDDDVVEVSD
ncbi:MAG TPA: nuclear transport factor 2 family protein [Kofleriaceae bacterium]|nr:nuclear transport factor 2 family protein [Kofleriaceae bacterium]